MKIQKLKLPRRRAKCFALLSLVIFFVLAGANHFLNPDFYVQIMPPYLPAHLELVYLSGFFEILGGFAVLFPRLRAAAGWGLIVLLLAVFPANIHMVLHPRSFPEIPVFALYARLPVQFLLIAWAYWATHAEA